MLQAAEICADVNLFLESNKQGYFLAFSACALKKFFSLALFFTHSFSLLEGLEKKEITACTLGLAHSLSRYKLKFSPDKVDTMIIQAISLLDDLDKELNNYTMRLREWFGWHFPEMGKIVTDNIAFAKVCFDTGGGW